MENKELKLYCGQGYDFSNEYGLFEVRYDSKNRRFSRLSFARQFYDELQEEKAIWDLTRIPELLECHSYKSNKGKIK